MTGGLEMTLLHDRKDDQTALPQWAEPTELAMAAHTESLRGRRILIAGINYAPEHTGVGPYTTSMAECLASLGATVSVVTGVPHYPSWTVPPAYRRRLRSREHRNGVDVLRLWHYVPQSQSALRRMAYEMTFLSHALLTPRAAGVDVVLAVVPSLGGAIYGVMLARRLAVPVVVVVQDLMGKAASQSGIPGGARVAALASGMERWALRRATTVAVVADPMRTQLVSDGIPAERIVSLPNWSRVPSAERERETVRRELGWADGITVVLHTGNMGYKQDLGNVLQAAELLQGRPDLLFVFLGDGSQRAVLELAAAGRSNVRFLPPVGDAEYSEVLAAADLLLLNERPSVQSMSLPSKLTSYFRVGRPIVAATHPESASAEEIRRSMAGVLAPPGDPAALAEVICRVAAEPDSVRAELGDAGRLFAAAHLTQEAAVLRLVAALSLALHPLPAAVAVTS